MRTVRTAHASREAAVAQAEADAAAAVADAVREQSGVCLVSSLTRHPIAQERRRREAALPLPRALDFRTQWPRPPPPAAPSAVSELVRTLPSRSTAPAPSPVRAAAIPVATGTRGLAVAEADVEQAAAAMADTLVVASRVEFFYKPHFRPAAPA
jgi:hypothetical protein